MGLCIIASLIPAATAPSAHQKGQGILCEWRGSSSIRPVAPPGALVGPRRQTGLSP